MRIPRAIAMTMVGVLLLGTMLVFGCGRREQQPEGRPPLPKNPKVAEEEEAMQQAGAGKVIAVVPKGLTHDFWKSVEAGAKTAGEEYGAEIKWNGPSKETQVDVQVNIIKRFVSEGVNAIVMAACDATALVPHLQEAKDAGIIIVTIDSGISDDSIPISHIATDNEAAAAIAADKLAELIGEEGQVGVITFDPNAQSSIDREMGFREQIKAYPNIEIAEILCCDSDTNKALTVTQSMVSANPDLKGIFAANQPGGQGAAKALEDLGKMGDIKLVAFDSSETEVEALEAGVIQALIVQDPFAMGYKGVEAAIMALSGDPALRPEPLIDTAVHVVTKENLNDPEIQQIIRPLN